MERLAERKKERESEENGEDEGEIIKSYRYLWGRYGFVGIAQSEMTISQKPIANTFFFCLCKTGQWAPYKCHQAIESFAFEPYFVT